MESAGSAGAVSGIGVSALRQSTSKSQELDNSTNVVPKCYVDHLSNALGLLVPNTNGNTNNCNASHSSSGDGSNGVHGTLEGGSSSVASSSSSPSLLRLATRARRGRKASQGWWVGLSDALGLFADDDADDEDYYYGEESPYKDTSSLLTSHQGDRSNNGHGGTTSSSTAEEFEPAFPEEDDADHGRLPSRVAFVEGGDRAVALAFLEERANVSVLRVMAAHHDHSIHHHAGSGNASSVPYHFDRASLSSHTHHRRQEQPPDGNILPPASKRLSLPPVDLPEPPPLRHEAAPGVLVWPPPQGLPAGLPLEVCTPTNMASVRNMLVFNGFFPEGNASFRIQGT